MSNNLKIQLNPLKYAQKLIQFQIQIHFPVTYKQIKLIHAMKRS